MYKAVLFPKDREEALSRWQSCRFNDPFQSIPPALLSANEIRNYAQATGMVFPFADKNLKAASYQVGMGGTLVRWDGEKRIDQKISSLEEIVLPANSITFVETGEEFFLPHYMAIRFNLKITHVHRGLLLGTGPLVDPGFAGRLLIPLHNLTSTDYVIKATQDLIWIEFTKTTFCCKAKESTFDSTKRDFFVFPESKLWLTPSEYLLNAGHGLPIASSIPQIISESAEHAKQSADSARQAALDVAQAKDAAQSIDREVKRIRNLAIFAGSLTLIAAVAGMIAIYFQAVSVVRDAALAVKQIHAEQPAPTPSPVPK